MFPAKTKISKIKILKILAPKMKFRIFRKTGFGEKKVRFSKNLKFHFGGQNFENFDFANFRFLPENFIFWNWKKKVEYSFDVKNDALSIYEVFSAFPALYRGFSECLGRANW